MTLFCLNCFSVQCSIRFPVLRVDSKHIHIHTEDDLIFPSCEIYCTGTFLSPSGDIVVTTIPSMQLHDNRSSLCCGLWCACHFACLLASRCSFSVLQDIAFHSQAYSHLMPSRLLLDVSKYRHPPQAASYSKPRQSSPVASPVAPP